MVITVAHTRAVENDAVIQQGAITILGTVHFLDEPREQRHLMRIDFRVLLNVVRIELVMRHAVMRLWDANIRVRASAQLSRHLRAAYSCHISLVGQDKQVEQQVHVVIVCLWHTTGLRHRWQRSVLVVCLRPLDPTFDLPHRIKIVFHRGSIPQAQSAFQTTDTLCDRIEDAAIGLHLRQPRLDTTSIAEQPLEHHPRIAFVRQWRSSGAPGGRVLVGTAVTVFTVAHRKVRIGGQLKRPQRGLGTQLIGRVLVDGFTSPDIGTFCTFR